MKAIYLNKYGAADKAFEIKEAPVPQAGPRDVIIKSTCFGLNFADVVARRGLYPDAPKNPAILGYDVAGHISEIGNEVTEFKVGDRVAALTRFGGYGEYVKTMVEGVTALPDSLGDEQGAALATQACTAYYSAVHCVNLQPDDKVLIQAAAGGVGSILTQIAKHKGCQVIGTASSGKMDFLKENGVDIAIDYTKKDFSQVIKDKLGAAPLDVVFDSIGGSTFKKAWKLIQPGGTMVNFGAAAQVAGSNKLKSLGVVAGFGLFTPLQLLMSSRSMIGVNMLRIADHKPQLFQRVFSGVMEMADQGIIQPILSKNYRPEEIAEAHSYLESRQSIGKITITW
jgi:NADPH2:quinone reductase